MTHEEQIEVLNQLVAEDDGVAEAIMTAIDKIARDMPEVEEMANVIGTWTINLADPDA